MAPVSDRIYFPSLQDCLYGDRVLLSWKHVATALSDHTGQRQISPAVIDFFDDEYVHGLLKDPASVFASPTEATKKDYDTKTAPINTTSSTSGRVDITTVKQDAEWLSKNARLNLVAALRVVVVEIQSRPSRHLTGPLSSQDATNLQEAAGLNNGQGASFLSDLGAADAADAEEIWKEFERTEIRRRRLFETYLIERQHFMMSTEYAHSIKLYGRLPIFTPLEQNLSRLYRLTMPAQAKDEIDGLLSTYLRIVGDRISKLDPGIGDLTDDKMLVTEEMDMLHRKTLLVEIVHAMAVVFQLADNLEDHFPASSAVSSWFSVMDQTAFMSRVHPGHDSNADLIVPLRSLAAVTSVALLKPGRCMLYFQEREDDPALADSSYDSYLLSSDVLEQVHTTMMAASEANIDSAGPVCLAWSVILGEMNKSYHSRSEKRDNLLLQSSRERFEAGVVSRTAAGRRNSAGSIYSIESSRFDVFLENSAVSKDLQTAERIAHAVSDGGRVYEVLCGMATGMSSSSGGSMTPLMSSRLRAWLVEVVQTGDKIVGYQDVTVLTLLTLLSVDREYWDITKDRTLGQDQDVIATMVGSQWLQERFLQIALDRYPQEFLPFISLCRILCSTMSLGDDEADQILGLLRRTPTLTFHLPRSARWDELEDTDSTNYFRLTNEIPLVPEPISRVRRHADDEDFCIPPGTEGRFLAQSGGFSQVEYHHSTLALLGQRLEVNLGRDSERSIFASMDHNETSEVIVLFATLIRIDCLRAAKTNPNGSLVHLESDILHEASKHIAGGRDLVTIVCATMDYYLQDEVFMSDDAAISVLNSCVEFFHSILPLHPSRVWSYLARCDLLSSESRAGKLAKITGNLDLVSTRFDFLSSSVRLFSDLIDTAITSAVQRRVGNKAVGRQRPDANPWLGTSEKVLSRVSYSIAQASIDIFENTATWRFETDEQRITLLDSVVPILNNVVSYCYSMGDCEGSATLTSTLRPAASFIVDCFVQPSSGTLRFQPILNTLIAACMSPQSTLFSSRTQSLHSQVNSTLEFSTTLLRVADLLEQQSSMIESYLFKSCTLLARLCGASSHYRVPSLRLLNSLIVNAGKSTGEPPSLLGYLGPQTSKSFLQQMSTLGSPFSLGDDVKTTWKFFSSILRNRQQWMSNCVLTGQTPREAMRKDIKKSEIATDSIFAIALGKLSKLKELDASQALVILDFVASAQNYWPWTVFTLQKDTTYLSGLQDYVRDLQPSHVTVKTNAILAAVQARIAAYIGETMAMQLYHSRHLGNADALATKLVTDLDYYLRDGVEVAGYNKSLHNNFAKNFSTKYAGCSLDDFQRTLLEPRELGRNFYYDLDRANAMLSFDPGWLGRKQNGFKMEMELANANLSLVDAQIALFHAWEFLLLELSICLPTNDTIAKQMLQVAQQCLNANQVVPGPESIFLKVVDARANLALVLIQRLATASLPVKDINHLLTTVVGTINGVEDPFSPDTIPYYRKLLKALFVVLRAYQLNADKPASETDDNMGGAGVMITQTVLNVLDRVVGRGFRSLVTLIHDDQASVCAEDLALLTAILQACLSLPSMEQSQTQILNIMASHSCFYSATSLFSWADKLADQGDPIYGELSILFLLELSTLPLLAEQMACDGVLSILLTANLTKYMLKANISPYSDIAVAQRCYGIWVKGLLPLMLNLLTALGATVAPEIAYVLNQFPHFLSLSIDRFEAPGASRTQSRSTPHYITLLGTSEIHSLALLTRVLAALRANNNRDIPEVEWDTTGLLENVEFWLSSNKLLKERLMPLGQREMDWRAMKKSSGKGDNVLEQKVISQLEAVRDVLSEELEAE